MKTLLFFMTPGTGLADWERIGILHRELAPFCEYKRRGWEIALVTFGRTSALASLPFTVYRFPHARLLFVTALLFYNRGRQACLIRTNQSAGSWWYVLAALIWRKPVLLRCGYVQGEYLETTSGRTAKTTVCQWLEGWAFRHASHCLVPTPELASWVRDRYGVREKDITILPNFVDTETFRPDPGISKMPWSVISVGRLHPVKRFDMLIRACARIPGCRLCIVGEGPERRVLKELASSLSVRLDLPGSVPNEHLPGLLNKHQVFAMTSQREGHPKALIEAMACGLPCVGVKAAGVENIIRHGSNGLLSDAAPDPVASCVRELFDNADLLAETGRRAREDAERFFSRGPIMEKEMRIAERLAGRMPAAKDVQ